MSAYVQVRKRRTSDGDGYYVRFCELDGCHRPGTQRETIAGYDTVFMCDPCAKVAREAWASALQPAAARCNQCPDGRLLPGARGQVVDCLTCVDCGRVVPTGSMKAAA